MILRSHQLLQLREGVNLCLLVYLLAETFMYEWRKRAFGGRPVHAIEIGIVLVFAREIAVFLAFLVKLNSFAV